MNSFLHPYWSEWSPEPASAYFIASRLFLEITEVENRRKTLIRESHALGDQILADVESFVFAGLKELLSSHIDEARIEPTSTLFPPSQPIVAFKTNSVSSLPSESSGYGSVSDCDLIDLNEEQTDADDDAFAPEVKIKQSEIISVSVMNRQSDNEKNRSIPALSPDISTSPIDSTNSLSPIKGIEEAAYRKSTRNDKVSTDPRRLYITNIPFRFEESHLRHLCQDYGRVRSAEVIYNDKGSKGFGFVTMGTVQEAQAVIRKLDQMTIEGRVINVNWAHRKKAPPAPAPKDYVFRKALALFEN